MTSVLRSQNTRFWSKVKVANDCWLWQGTTPAGYGQYALWSRGSGVNRQRGTIPAHRYAYEQFIGEVPEGLELDHLCRVKNCVNPQHLEPVTHRENCLRAATVRQWPTMSTHCDKGHDRSLWIVYRKNGHRECRLCNRETLRRWRLSDKKSVVRIGGTE